ncbi:hypothetical protein L9F63_011370, partial [Diploptera punctata]
FMLLIELISSLLISKIKIDNMYSYIQQCCSSESCMELYSMPQLDKTSPVYSNTQYEGGGDDISNRRSAASDVKKYGSVSSDTLPLLTSSAWSAVIHRPADEDSEPDDLPSTVDMDESKERSKEEASKDVGDAGGSESEEISDSEHESYEGSESGSCSWSDSDSDSGSSSCSSGSGCSSGRSSHTHQTFSIRETNFDQGTDGNRYFDHVFGIHGEEEFDRVYQRIQLEEQENRRNIACRRRQTKIKEVVLSLRIL